MFKLIWSILKLKKQLQLRLLKDAPQEQTMAHTTPWINQEKKIRKKLSSLYKEKVGRIPNPFEEEKQRLRDLNKNALFAKQILPKIHDSRDFSLSFEDEKRLKLLYEMQIENLANETIPEKIAEYRFFKENQLKNNVFSALFKRGEPIILPLTEEEKLKELLIEKLLQEKRENKLLEENPLSHLLIDTLLTKIWGRTFLNPFFRHKQNPQNFLNNVIFEKKLELTKKLEKNFRGRPKIRHMFVWLRMFFRGLTVAELEGSVFHPL